MPLNTTDIIFAIFGLNAGTNVLYGIRKISKEVEIRVCMFIISEREWHRV